MNRWESAAQARRALDRRFEAIGADDLRQSPRAGWARTIRNALGMSQADLARRLQVSPPAVTELERREREETISIGKLAGLAQAMNCTFVYAFIPHTTLEDTVQSEARQRALESLGYVARTMDLEDQGLDSASAQEMLDRETRRVIEQHRVWRRG